MAMTNTFEGKLYTGNLDMRLDDRAVVSVTMPRCGPFLYTARSMAVAMLVSLAVAADDYGLKTLVEPVTFSCELRDVRLTRVIDKMNVGASSVAREVKSSSDRWTESSGARSTAESTTGNLSSYHSEGGNRSGTKFEVGGSLKWGLIPSGKIGGEYSNGRFDEWRSSTDKTATTKHGNSNANAIAFEGVVSEGKDSTLESTFESRLGGYVLVFSVALRNMDATDRLKVDGAHMRAQLSSGDLPGIITAPYKERGEFWLGAEETICEFVYQVEDAKMLKALQYLEGKGELGRLNLSMSGANITVISEKTGRNVLSDLNAAETCRPGTRFSMEFGELTTLPDWRVSRRHSAKSGQRGKRVCIREALLAIQSAAIGYSEVLPSEIFIFSNDGGLTNVVDRPLLNKDSGGRYRLFALRLTKNNGVTDLSMPNAEVMKAEIADYAKVALFSFGIDEFVNVAFENPLYFSRLENEIKEYLCSCEDKNALNVFKELQEKKIREEDVRPLPEDKTKITDADVKRFKERAKAGVPEMQVKWARCLIGGWRVEKDAVEAVRWYRKAAEQGNAEAQFNLGICYHTGEGVSKNVVETVKWFRRAAEQGHAEAQLNIGMCYHTGECVSKDVVEAVKWYRKAAGQGIAEAQYILYLCYHGGIGAPKDDVEAVKWCRKAAEQGHAGAQHCMGLCYWKGEGVPNDELSAVKWFRKAAEQGHVAAQRDLGKCYYGGEGIAKDMVEAVKWFRKAAERDDAQAQFLLGSAYGGGNGVEVNVIEAMKWIRKAAEQGIPEAQFVLGVAYITGEGVPADESEAEKWFLKAKEQGFVPDESVFDGLLGE
ncbi:MAG: SEL1-like repeat protein [Kiritimatiellae bacterium]|nr:SEL1-like repeat protein [Kiritimatiellia bacterium]